MSMAMMSIHSSLTWKVGKIVKELFGIEISQNQRRMLLAELDEKIQL